MSTLLNGDTVCLAESYAGQALLERAAPIGRSRIDKVSTRKRLEAAPLLLLLSSPPHQLPAIHPWLSSSLSPPLLPASVSPRRQVAILNRLSLSLLSLAGADSWAKKSFIRLLEIGVAS